MTPDTAVQWTPLMYSMAGIIVLALSVMVWAIVEIVCGLIADTEE